MFCSTVTTGLPFMFVELPVSLIVLRERSTLVSGSKLFRCFDACRG